MVSLWPVSSSPTSKRWNTSVLSSKIPSAALSDSLQFTDKTLIVITGPTAVGKTQLCLDIARHFDIPIINADSRQIYKELSIGTAKPSAEDLQQVKHYFVGTLSLQDYYSASLFETQVMDLLGTLFQQSDYALMAGGSMMYIDAVCDGIDDIPTIDDETRATMKRRLAEEGLPKLCEELQRLAEQIGGNPFILNVRKSIVVSECKKVCQSIQQYSRWSAPAMDYRKIAEEIIRRTST